MLNRHWRAPIDTGAHESTRRRARIDTNRPYCWTEKRDGSEFPVWFAEAAPVLDFPFTNETGLGILRCPAQGEITIAAKVSGQPARRRRNII